MPKKTTASKTNIAKTSGRKGIKSFFIRLLRRPLSLRSRRAHKSFVLTRRRDIPKRPRLPGYLSFTWSVCNTLWHFRKPLFGLLAVYVVVGLLLIGVSQQDEYRTITDTLQQADAATGTEAIGTLTKVAGVFGATLFGSLSASLTELQQFYLILVYVLMWLAIVWMLRQLLAGNAVKVRDGLYHAGAPLIPAFCIAGLMVVQVLPGALGLLVFSIATQGGVIAGGAAAMMFGVGALLLVVLSLYWLTSSFFALLIVTLPGTYPMTAIRGAGDIALGRRTSLMLRLLWLAVILGILWAFIVLPALLVDFWMKVSWLPLVTISVQVATGMSLIFGVGYVFLLYRRMIERSDE